MNNDEERLKAYKEKLYDNYEIVSELTKHKLPTFKKVIRVLCDPKDEQELRLAEAYLDNSIAINELKWAIDNGVMKHNDIDSNEAFKLLIDYSINATKSIFEKRSLKSFVEERFGTITPEISAKMMYQIILFPKQEKIKEYLNNVLKKQGIEMTKMKFVKFSVAFTNCIIKMATYVPRVFKINDTEQDINNYEIYCKEFKKLCEKGLKDSIKEYWNSCLSKLDPEDTYKKYNNIRETNKEVFEIDFDDEEEAVLYYKYLSKYFSIKNPDDKSIDLILLGIFSHKPIVEAWFDIELFENSFDKPTHKYPSYIKEYLEEVIRESKDSKLSEKPKEYSKRKD